jgi:hypothetical protein
MFLNVPGRVIVGNRIVEVNEKARYSLGFGLIPAALQDRQSMKRNSGYMGSFYNGKRKI